MGTISQRELRNDNASVVRDVERGASYTITRRGVPVARLVPVTDDVDLRCLRPATKRTLYAAVRRIETGASTRAVLDDLRGDR